MKQDLAREVAGILLRSRHTLAFTGAGISVESGIPPFRGSGGIWDNYDPRLLEIGFFVLNPARSWEAIKEIFYGKFRGAKPNAAHLTLAKWQKNGILRRVITQNIDNLHQEAGSENVIEFHGNAQRLSCLDCQRQYPIDPILIARAVPSCPKCGGLLKPDFIFFGEGIPHDAYHESFAEATGCDCMLIIGTSGEVAPANQIPITAASNGAFIIEINTEISTYSKHVSNLIVREPSGSFLPAVDQFINNIPA
ncbi:MAG: NAD-dependent deacylase [Bacteroidetes bacterium]|nr:NAD-dependent deacylase [Bacteroidota bacterium]